MESLFNMLELTGNVLEALVELDICEEANSYTITFDLPDDVEDDSGIRVLLAIDIKDVVNQIHLMAVMDTDGFLYYGDIKEYDAEILKLSKNHFELIFKVAAALVVKALKEDMTND
jgi:hypothetical protein